MPRSSSTSSSSSTGIGASRPPAAAPHPTGRNVPTDPPKQVDPSLQAAMERVRPAPGFLLSKLLLAPERAELMSLPTDTTALLEAAFVRVLALHPSDDELARAHPPGSVVIASLEGIAPLLVTHAFLLPAERIMGWFPIDGLEAPQPLGFQHT